MSGRDELLKQIKIMGKGTRGPIPAILELPDSTLYDIIEQMKRGLSNRAIARHLRKCGMKGSEHSLQQAVIHKINVSIVSIYNIIFDFIYYIEELRFKTAGHDTLLIVSVRVLSCPPTSPRDDSPTCCS